MSPTGFLWFIVTIVIVVGAIMGLAWALEYMGTPEKPRRILIVVAIVVGAVFIIAYVLRLLGGVTLFPI